jgi:uncharacterized protein (UPF0335 family)
MGGPVDIPGEQLRMIVDVEQEIRELTEVGLVPKVLREIVRLRKQDQKSARSMSLCSSSI